MTETLAEDPAVLLRLELGKFLSKRVSGIVEAWLKLVKADPRLTTPERLPIDSLKDHVPSMVESFARSLERGANSPEAKAKSDAAIHGTERWLQGYSIRELLLEIYWLRSVLFKAAGDFARGRPDELSVCSSSCVLIDAFLNDLESRSVQRYTEESEAALNKSNNARFRLIRSISHELRNMMNSVGLASVLLDAGDPEAVQQMRQSLDANVSHMKEVVDDLLNLSSILSRQAIVKPSWINLSALSSSLNAGYQSLAESQGLHFTSSIKGNLDKVYSDEIKIRLIIENLVSNAVTYTAKGEVSLTLEAIDDNQFAIVVQDSGVGIAKEDREHLFTDSYIATPESPLRGLGLGLAVVSGLVDLLKGSIELKSVLSQGSVFRVVLPRYCQAVPTNLPIIRSLPPESGLH